MPPAERATPESDFLAAAMRLSLASPGAELELVGALPALDWQRVLWLGRREGVLLHLRQALLAAGSLSRCPPEIPPQLQALAEVTRLRQLESMRELCLLADELQRQVVPAVLIEPRLTSAQDAWDQAEERENFFHFHVPAADRDRAAAILRARGHAADATPAALIRPGQRPVFFNRELAAHPQAERLLRSATSTTVAGRTLLTLSPAHALLASLHRGPNAHCPSLAQAWNTVRLCGSLTHLAPALEEAARFGLQQELHTHLQACFQRLALPPPPAVKETALAELKQPTRSGQPVTLPHAPFLPTPTVVLDRMIALAGLQSTDVVCDLGSGDGRIVFRALESGVARAIGIDENSRLIEEARAHAAAIGAAARAEFINGDIFTADLRSASVVFCYLLPAVMPPLLTQLLRECRPGTRIVAHDYIFGDWPPERTELVRTGLTSIAQIYLWRVPPCGTDTRA